jgi:hypothetical protein
MTDLDRAEARAALAREKLNTTVGALQAQLEPQVLMQKAKETAVDGGERAARASVDVARRNPAALAGGVALLAAFLGRHRIAGGVRRLFGKKPLPTQKPSPSQRVREDDVERIIL